MFVSSTYNKSIPFFGLSKWQKNDVHILCLLFTLWIQSNGIKQDKVYNVPWDTPFNEN